MKAGPAPSRPPPAPSTQRLRTTVTQGYESQHCHSKQNQTPGHSGESLGVGLVANHLIFSKPQFGWNLHSLSVDSKVFKSLVCLLWSGLV